MKRFDISKEQRKEKINERQNLEKRKQVKDRRFHPIEDDELVETLFNEYLHGEKYYDETDA
jgi:hypothetical protein